MWNSYRQLAERDFPLRFSKDPESKYWEMYVACALCEIGFQVCRGDNGRDGCVWVEAIAPEPGDSANPDHVPDPPANAVSETPVRQIILRLTGAIYEKQKKFSHYRKSGIIGPTDKCVIALSGAKLRFPITIDYLQRALYEAGDLYLSIDPVSLKAVDRGRRHEPKIAKTSHPPFNKPTFLDDSCSHVSALIFGWKGSQILHRSWAASWRYSTITVHGILSREAG